MPNWTVTFSREAGKQYNKLKRSGSKPSITDIIDYLGFDLEKEGPYLVNWPNYSPLDKNKFHCHLRKGRPTYIACWEIINNEAKQIEVYYVGSHEGAPY